jgi:hypothetical protein
MTVSKICEHKELLFEIVNSSTGKTTKIFQKCDLFLIEILIEIIINTDLFYNDKNKNKGWKKVVNYFKSKSVLSSKRVRTFLIKHILVVQSIIASVLSKILEEAVICAFTQ